MSRHNAITLAAIYAESRQPDLEVKNLHFHQAEAVPLGTDLV